MKELRYSTKTKKYLKKYRNTPRKMEKLYEVLNILINDIEIPETFLPHKLIRLKVVWNATLKGIFF